MHIPFLVKQLANRHLQFDEYKPTHKNRWLESITLRHVVNIDADDAWHVAGGDDIGAIEHDQEAA